MKVISTSAHGIMDYFMGVLLISMPWLFGFSENGAETWVPVVLGAGVLLYSMLTDYETSVARIIPFRIHLTLDMLGGAFLAASPWLFGFNDRVYLPHVIVGVLEILAALMAQTHPVTQRDTSAVPGQHRTGPAR